MTRSPLKRISRRKAAQATARRKCMTIVRKRSGGLCEAVTPVCTRYGQDGHEIRKQSQQGDPTDPANVRHVCRACHIYIGNHQAWAYSVGLLIRSWEAKR